MAKTTYQTYTAETPFDTYRDEFLRRGAMCGALSQQHPELAAVAATADATVTQIDAKRAALREAEDDQIKAKALEDVAKIGVIDFYKLLRGTMSAKGYNVLTLLPDAPSALQRVGVATFSERVALAVSNLKTLPDGDEIKAAFLAGLEAEIGEFGQADKAEDATRLALQSGRMALTLYKSELSQAREAELGKIQNVLRDREKTALFTLPWRKTGKAPAEGAPAAEPEGSPPVA
jgi:hypothetical protein